MIIYGWGYFNRREYRQARERCPHCGHNGFLRSYTATRYVTLYFVPLVPTGKTRVLNECPVCKMGRHMSYGQWKRLRAKSLPEAREKWTTNPSDEAATRTLLGIALDLGDRETFAEVASVARKRFSQNEELLMGIANGYESLLDPLEAQATFLEVADIGGERKDACLRAAEQSLRKAEDKPPRPPNRWLQSAPVMIVPTALAAGLVWILSTLFVKTPEHVYFINGTAEPYSVIVDGEEIRLVPQYLTPVDLAYGDHSIAPGRDASPFAPFESRIEVGLFERLSDDEVFVFNPDRTALIISHRIAYAVRSEDATKATTFRPLVGNSTYRFTGIEDAFTDPPHEVELPSSTGIAYRDSLELIAGVGPLDVAFWLNEQGKEKLAHTMLECSLEWSPDDFQVLGIYSALAPQDIRLKFFQRHLADEPVRVTWHRAYQEAMIAAGNRDQLTSEYNALLMAHPDEGDYYYLRGRFEPSREITLRLLNRAVEVSPDCAYAHFGLAWHEIMAAHFEEALPHLEVSLAAEPENYLFSNLAFQLFQAREDWDGLEADARRRIEQHPDLTENWAQLVLALAARNEVAQARAELSRCLQHFSQLSTEEKQSIRQRMELVIANAREDRNAVDRSLQDMEGPEYQFDLALLRGDLDTAIRAADELSGDMTSVVAQYYLVRAFAATRQQPAVVRACDFAIQRRAALQPYETAEVCDLFKGERAPTLDAVLAVGLRQRDMCSVLYALGEAYPDQRKVFHAQAARLNFSRDARRMVLKDML